MIVTVEDFKADLQLLESIDVYRRYILTGSCAKLEDVDAYKVRSQISKQFDVEYNDVVIVGSANLGFSIKPRKRFINFGEDSDIDIAIVSSKLFETIWKELYEYDKLGSYWPDKKKFKNYLFKGWIRPDLLPSSEIFSFSNQWWEFFRSLSANHTSFKVAGGIYHSHFFLEQYQLICIEQCKAEI